MNRIDKTFTELKKQNKTAFIGFVTLGDPNPEDSITAVQILANNGCDIIELGLPFSDPIAEGPVIQEANIRALENGMNTQIAMAMVKDIRQTVLQPLIFLLYYNQIFKYGIDRFFKEAHEAGIDGLIIPDLPYEHCQEVDQASQRYQIHIISMVTPVSGKRKEMLVKDSKGFVYCVTSVGVTGQRSSFDADLKAFMEELSHYTKTPKALGFGISNETQVRIMKEYAEGVIVGSAIVQVVERIAKKETTFETLAQFIRGLANACHE